MHEAANIERFAADFADEPAIVVPAVHHDLSAGRVLVMDWVEGENLAIALRRVDHDTAEEAARLLVDAYLKQILVDGFLHADPHPGNFLLQDGPRLGVVDFGACAAISERSRLGAARGLRARPSTPTWRASSRACTRSGCAPRQATRRGCSGGRRCSTSIPTSTPTRARTTSAASSARRGTTRWCTSRPSW